jgi:predicted nucleic acid-binding protein
VIVLDTNVVSELMKPSPDAAVARWLQNLSTTPLATTVITVAEITYGLHRLDAGRRRSGLESRFEQLVDPQGGLALLSADQLAAREAGRFQAHREANGLAATPSGMMIAGIAAVSGAQLATRNLSDFTLLPITTINPWSS